MTTTLRPDQSPTPADFSPWKFLQAGHHLVTIVVFALSFFLFPISTWIERQLTWPEVTIPLSQIIANEKRDDSTGAVIPGQRIIHYELLNPGPGTLEGVQLVITAKGSDVFHAFPINGATQVTVDAPPNGTTVPLLTPRLIKAVPVGNALSPKSRIGVIVMANGVAWTHEKLESITIPGPRRSEHAGASTASFDFSRMILWLWWAVLAVMSAWALIYFFFFLPNEIRKGFQQGLERGLGSAPTKAASILQQTNPDQLGGKMEDAMKAEARQREGT